MKTKITYLTMAIIVVFTASLNLTSKPKLNNEAKAKKIAKKMNNRNDGRTTYDKTVLMTCSFKVINGKKKCVSKPRKKVFESISKDTGKNLKDKISLSLLQSPATEKGMAFLQKDYDDKSRNSEQWMYMPALKKLKRIVSQSSNAPKTGTMFGSEIAYEEIEKTHLSDYYYSYDGDGNLDGGDVFLITMYPTKKRARKTSYSKLKMWVDKKSYISKKIEMYGKRGKLKKTMFAKKISKRNGVYFAKRMIIVNHINKRMSMMKIIKNSININVPIGLFKTRALEDANYRETQMNKIRKFAK